MVYAQLCVLFFFFRSCFQHPVFIFCRMAQYREILYIVPVTTLSSVFKVVVWQIIIYDYLSEPNCTLVSFQLTVEMRRSTSSFKCAHRKICCCGLQLCTLTEVKDKCAHKVLKPSQLAHQPQENTKGRRQMSENRQGYLQGVLWKTATQSDAKYEYVK